MRDARRRRKLHVDRLIGHAAWTKRSMAASTAGSQILLRGSVEETMTKVAGLAASAGVGAGAELFRENNCFACHRLGNAGGDLGPDLTHVGARLPRPIIEAILDHKLEEERRGRR